jgi:microsomal epoxide hydrolase
VAWSDVTPADETIIESVTLYWITQSIERCIYPYRDVSTTKPHSPRFLRAERIADSPLNCQNLPKGFATFVEVYAAKNSPATPTIPKPMGFSRFPFDICYTPRTWATHQGDLVFYRSHDKVSQMFD